METGVARNLPARLPADDEIAAFRRFNRLYTRFIGTLQEGLLDTPYSLSEARVLYELATRQRPLAKEIAQELDMDAGYLSRILNKFHDAGLLKRAPSREDGRQAHLTLTRVGRGAFRHLNTRSDQQANSILGGLAPAPRRDLIRSMRTLEDVLSTTERAKEQTATKPFTLRPHRPGDMGLVVQREGSLYAQEYGWDERFEALAARVVADFIDHFDPTCERCWIAEHEGEHLGHIFLVKHPDQTGIAKLRLLLVEPSARGMGLGHALVAECIRFAREAGYHKITLWTQSILTAAHRIYQAAGFRLVHQEPHHSFGKDLIAQTWELDLI
ncbi:MAG TPA: helix-turn-helix domain-containing GNAT family N-acetyltransferase [Acidobacteriaceae bacterium]|jgi:DNA-binding MarR family transcriptional regulator/GNAT superfamily N-acetyltransferase|nr:helix-turn-helix domain-containing GNAT family N-acetyltransferase [Acidobacteriaceae bacterium]